MAINSINNSSDVENFIAMLEKNKNIDEAVRIFNTMREFAILTRRTNPNAKVVTDFDNLMKELTPDQTSRLASIFHKYAEAHKNDDKQETTSSGKQGYDGWYDETRKEKVKAKTDEEAKAHGGTKAGDEYEVVIPGGTYEQMFGTPKMSKKGRAALYGFVLPSLGITANTTGSALNDYSRGIADYHSVLGDAMYAMANNVPEKLDKELGRAERLYYTNAAKKEHALAAKAKAKGAVANDIATGIGATLNNIASIGNARDEAARQAQLMINEHPVSDFYRDSASIRKWANSNGGKK